MLFYISWSRRLLEKVICKQSTERKEGELKYLEGKNNEPAQCERRAETFRVVREGGCGQELESCSGGMKTQKDLAFYEKKSSLYILWFLPTEYL